MKLEKAKELVLDALCEEFDNSGSELWVSAQQLHKKLNHNEYVKENGGVTFGLVEVSLDELFKESLALYGFNGETVRASRDAYLKWLYSKHSKTGRGNEKDWEPLHVENYETVADNIDGVAKSLETENGYIAHYPLETTHNHNIKEFIILTKG